MLFSKKWHTQFLLHFLIHIDVLMLCRKFELIPTKISRYEFHNGLSKINLMSEVITLKILNNDEHI